MLTISRKGLRAAFVLTTALTVSASAQAATIEFTSASWSGADNATTETVADVTATAGPAGAKLSYAADFGLGIDYVPHPADLKFDDESLDQIELEELLTISFGTPTLIESFTVSNLFREWPASCDNGCGNQQYEEVGSYSLDGGFSWTPFTARNDGNGRATVQLGGISLKDIVFSTNSEEYRYDFSLAAIETVDMASDVPEPTTMVLLGAGLLIGASRLRRRN